MPQLQLHEVRSKNEGNVMKSQIPAAVERIRRDLSGWLWHFCSRDGNPLKETARATGQIAGWHSDCVFFRSLSPFWLSPEDTMSKKNHAPGPVPPGNQPHTGPAGNPDDAPNRPDESDQHAGAPFQEQDEKRRLGGYTTAGEHAIQQPGRLNDGDIHSR